MVKLNIKFVLWKNKSNITLQQVIDFEVIDPQEIIDILDTIVTPKYRSLNGNRSSFYMSTPLVSNGREFEELTIQYGRDANTGVYVPITEFYDFPQKLLILHVSDFRMLAREKLLS